MEGSDETDLEKVKAIYEEWARGDYSGHADVFHPEMKAETFGMGEPIRSETYDEFIATMREWLSTWERPFKIEAEELIQEGERILALIRWRGRGKGSGVAVDDRGAHLWTFRDGKVVRYETFRDPDEARVALEAR
jgi:ketosteroid isomerase-like protein